MPLPVRPSMPTRRPLIVALLALLALLVAALLPAGATAKPRTKWLCKPGKDDDPCRTGLATTKFSAAGEQLGVSSPKRSRPRRIDCFYVYPTVSDQQTQNADRSIDPELRSIARYQVARYSQHCRVFAPVYRQVTLAALDPERLDAAAFELAYRDVRRAWRSYNRKRRRDRGVVLIGHSQGTFMLEQLIAEKIDSRPAARRRLVVAILLGGGVSVAEGRDRGGSFERIRACRSDRQLGCVIAFATFNDTVPPDAIFGRTDAVGEGVLCTNPAALGGGSGRLRSVYASEPFAPGTTIGLATALVGAPEPPVDTPWYESRAYTGECSSADGANVLQIEELPGAPALNAVPDATWGLHLVDANIALGNLVGLVREKARRFTRARG